MHRQLAIAATSAPSFVGGAGARRFAVYADAESPCGFFSIFADGSRMDYVPLAAGPAMAA